MFFLNEIITDENLVSEGLGVLLQEIQFISNRILKFGSQRLHTAQTKSQHSRNTIWNNMEFYYYDSMILDILNKLIYIVLEYNQIPLKS